MYQKILNCLIQHNLQYTVDEECNGIALIDCLTPDDEPTIKLGLVETTLLAESIYEALKD